MNIIEAMKCIRAGKKITTPRWFWDGKGISCYIYGATRSESRNAYINTRKYNLTYDHCELMRFYDSDIEDNSWIEWDESMYSEDGNIKDNIWRYK